MVATTFLKGGFESVCGRRGRAENSESSVRKAYSHIKKADNLRAAES